MERAKLAEARYERGWSQEEAAEQLGVTRTTISQWERGITTPYPIHIHRLCMLYGKSAAELGLLQEPQALSEEKEALEASKQDNKLQEILFLSSQTDIKDSIQTESRTFEPVSENTGMTSTSQNSISTLNDLHRLSYNLTQLFRLNEATPEVLEMFASLTQMCRHLSEGNDLKTAEQVLWAYLPRIESIAKLSFRDQQKAASITSEGYLLAASLVGHHNDLKSRQHFSEQALLYGKLARDLNLQIAALRQLAITFDYLEQPKTVLQIYQQTLPYLHNVSSLLRACIYAGISGTYAQLYQQSEALRFLDLAYENFPENAECEPSFLQPMCKYATLIFCEGLSRLDFHQPQEAEKVFARIDGLLPKIPVPEKVRIELLNYQAEASTMTGDLERAHTYLEEAVRSSLILGSMRRYYEAYEVYKQMRVVWPYENRIKALGHFFFSTKGKPQTYK